MKSPLQRPFFAVFQNEVLLNSKRVAPYVLMLLFIVNALMWSVRGAAVTRGWATNSDFNIARNILAFSWFLGLPIFNAVIMGDPVLRDFRLGVQAFPFFRGDYALSVRGYLLYGRNSYSQKQNRLPLSCLLLSNLRRDDGFLTKAAPDRLEKRS